VLWQEHTGAFRALSFTAGGKELVTACAKGTVRRWPLEPEALIRMACERAGAGRNLTPGEWQRYAPKGERFREGMPCGSGK
jgi:hypothetical protein